MTTEKTGTGLSLFESTYVNIIGNRFENNYKDADFKFFHTLDPGENIPLGGLPESYKKIRHERDLSNTWDNNYWNRPRYYKVTIKGELEVRDYYGNVEILTLENYDYNPKLRGLIDNLIIRFLENHPRMFQILRQLLGL